MKTGSGIAISLVLLLVLGSTVVRAQEATVTPDDPRYVGKLTDELLAAAGAADPLQKIEVFRAMARERIRELAAVQTRNRYEYAGELLDAYNEVMADGLQARFREAYSRGIDLAAAAAQVGRECDEHAARLRSMAQVMDAANLQKQMAAAAQHTYTVRIMTAYMGQVKGSPLEEIAALENTVRSALGRQAAGDKLTEAFEAGLALRLGSRELGEVVGLCGAMAEGGAWFGTEGPACVAEELRLRRSADGAGDNLQTREQLVSQVRERVWLRLQERLQQMTGDAKASPDRDVAQLREQLQQMMQNQERLQQGVREMRQTMQEMIDKKGKMDEYRREVESLPGGPH